MSRIPPADPTKIPEEGQKKKRISKAFWIALAISSASMVITAFLVGLIEYYALGGGELRPMLLRLFEDGVGLTGLMGFFVFLLSWASSKGAFDMLNYSIQLLFLTVFKPHFREDGKFPATFYDYKVKKDGEKRKPLLALLFVSLLFIGAGFILMAIYLKTK